MKTPTCSPNASVPLKTGESPDRFSVTKREPEAAALPNPAMDRRCHDVAGDLVHHSQSLGIQQGHADSADRR